MNKFKICYNDDSIIGGWYTDQFPKGKIVVHLLNKSPNKTIFKLIVKMIEEDNKTLAILNCKHNNKYVKNISKVLLSKAEIEIRR